MTRLIAATALSLALFCSACGNGPQDVAVGSGEQPGQDEGATLGPRGVKRDYEGVITVPEGVDLVSIEHVDPYKWTAIFRYTKNTSLLLNEMATMMKALDFRVRPEMEQPVVTTCMSGGLNPDGSGNCVTGGGIWAGGGNLTVSIERPSAAEPGTMRLVREFEHRCQNDPIGPPRPPGQRGSDHC